MHKKGIAIEALVRFVLMAVALFIVFKFGVKVAKTLGGSNTPAQFEEMVAKIEKIGSGEHETVFIMLEPRMAIAGFNSDSSKISCKQCLLEPFKDAYRPKDGSFEKPNAPECNSKNCICLCTDLDFRNTDTLYCLKQMCKETKSKISNELLSEETKQAVPWGSGFLFLGKWDNKVGGISSRHAVCIKREFKESQMILSVSSTSKC